MGKVKNEIEKIHRLCERLYNAGGVSSVIDYINAAIEQKNELIIKNVRYEHCDACDAIMPSIDHTCLICGQETKVTKQQLVDAVIEDLKEGFAVGDYTVLDELLHFIPTHNLIQALPEEDWNEFESIDDVNKLPSINSDTIWSEIRSDFEDEGFINIDAWVSEDPDESGSVIAKINVQTKEVTYIDKRAKTNRFAQEVIQERIRTL